MFAQSQSAAQQKCVNTLNKDGAKVAATQGKDNTACIKNATKGKEDDPQGCITADRKGKVAAAAAKTLADETKACTETPTLAASDGEVVSRAAVDEEVGLVGDVFGADLGAAINSTEAATGKCQATVSKNYEKGFAGAAKGFLKCLKGALKTASDPRDVASCIDALTAAVPVECPGVNLSAALPGACAFRLDTGECVGERVLCRACRMFNTMNNVSADCDRLDDGSVNSSCINRTFEVTKTADTADGSCDGDCSLREAIIAANAGSGLDEVVVPAGTFVLSLAGTGEDAAATGDLDVTDSLILRGGGATSTIIDGNAADRVLQVLSGVELTVSRLTVRNGVSGAGGGINNLGTTSISGCAISDNLADDGGGIANLGGVVTVAAGSVIDGNAAEFDGGGVLNFGAATLSVRGGSEITGNVAGRGGGIYSQSGTPVENAVLVLEGVAVAENDAIEGGGIYHSGASAEISETSISGNRADCTGGGLVNFGPASVTRSTISGNRASLNCPPEVLSAAGGIYNEADSLDMTNVTVSGNEAAVGSAILNFGTVTLASSTIGDNSAGETGGGGIVNLDQLTITGSIAAGNSEGNCASLVTDPPLSDVTSGGRNLADDATCAFNQPTDLQDVADARLGPLQDNGGPTETQALLSGSPAIDAGGTSCPATDQRGVARPQGAACDIGAFEAQP
jgi:CSLREA domain-containing protein